VCRGRVGCGVVDVALEKVNLISLSHDLPRSFARSPTRRAFSLVVQLVLDDTPGPPQHTAFPVALGYAAALAAGKMASPGRAGPKTPKTPKARAGKTPSKGKGMVTPRTSNASDAEESPRSSTKKGKKRLLRNDLVPDRPQGPNIVTLFHKDVNLFHLTAESQLYSASRLWMASDPHGELEMRPRMRGALAGFPLPLPDTSVAPWVHPLIAHSSFAERHARNALLDAVLDGAGDGAGAADDAGLMDATAGGYMSEVNPIKAEHMFKWQGQVTR
jgi:hypothetical protein